MKKILVVLLVAAGLGVKGQVMWQKTIQGNGGNMDYDWSYSINQTNDGGFVACGYTAYYGHGDHVYAIKIDSAGDLQWMKYLKGNYFERAYCIIQTTDSGYAICGHTNSFTASNYDAFITKLTKNGSIQWSRTIGGSDYETFNSVVQTTDGGYALCGYTKSFGAALYDFYVVKLSPAGYIQWTRILGGNSDDYGNSIIQTNDGGYVLVGYTWSYGAGRSDVYIIKLNSSGDVQWTRVIGGIYDDSGNSVIQSCDSGYVIAGIDRSYSFWGDEDAYFIKLDKAGNLEWTRTVGSVFNDGVFSIIQTPDKGYVACGATNGFGTTNEDGYLIKLDSIGNLLWSKIIGTSTYESCRSISKSKDGGYAICGTADFSGTGHGINYIIKLDSNFNSCGNLVEVSSISNTGGSVDTGLTAPGIGGYQTNAPFPILSAGSDSDVCSTIGIQEIQSSITFSIYPNPTNSTFTIESESRELGTELKIYDITGRLAYSTTLASTSSATKVTLNPKLGAGVYFVRVEDGERVWTEKLIIQHD